ncbi:30S ribosomal protein S6 [Candidatus Kryptobacter tengchongensis]|uniref:Small ribosomal subunit protein bS6 n=1 Tax=Kryptobacter tengchongensis TaxID=1643429 RepID=A0A656DAQ5_KRYT1|nr:30S ribosomal protein S6 [Candidatus Kryptobacter tengchongensis]CUT02182.1 SSU ribosomal protein S6P [Candidatus Kryptobacter tengchongensis]CUT03382.1 SSU ribosomal protein S6P [Candidatus Kryptobacter tengchongensis]
MARKIPKNMLSRRWYETTFLINASLDDPIIEQIIKKYENFIKEKGGEIILMERWGRRRLAYPINKKNSAFYVYFEYFAPPTIVSELERAFQLDENIMRYLTVVVTKKALKAKEQEKRRGRITIEHLGLGSVESIAQVEEEETFEEDEEE